MHHIPFHEENMNIDGWNVVMKFPESRDNTIMQNVQRLLYDQGIFPDAGPVVRGKHQHTR